MIAASRALVVLLACVPAIAHAQSPQASELFKEGRDLYKAGKYTEACDKFAHSQDMDPQIGTLFNLAQCDEKIGKLASALAAYREVVAKDTNAKRKAAAAELQSHLEPRVPKLVVQIVKPPPSLVLTLDGPTGAKPIDANQPTEIDLGEYTVIARADGFRELSAKVKIDTEGETKTIPVSLALVHGETEVTTVKHSETPVPEGPAPEHSRRKTYAYAALGVGGAAAITGIVFGVIARGKWNDAQAVCGGTTCPTQAQVDKAQALADDASSSGNLSTAFVLGGVALVATGVYLWVTAPSESAVHVTASTNGQTTGFVLSGRF